MSEQPIQVIGLADETKVAIRQNITQARDAAIIRVENALKVQIANDADLMLAVDARHDAANVRKTIEEARKIVKAPVLALGKGIDGAAETFMRDLVKLETQLTGAINHYQLQKERSRQAAEQKAEAEKREAEAKVEKLRLEAEAAMLAGDEEKALEASLALEAIPEPQLPAVTTQEVSGVKSRLVLDYRLQGADSEMARTRALWAFVKAYPELCTIEIKTRDLRERLNKGDCFNAAPGTIPNVPGLEIFETVNSRFK